MVPHSSVGRTRGFTLIELLVVLAILGVLSALVLASVQRVRLAAAKADCQNRLRQIALASHQYHDTHRQLPPGSTSFGGEFPYLSWLSRLLPYLEQQSLLDQARLDYVRQPDVWHPPTGHANLARPLTAFVCPSGDRATGRALYLTIQPDPFPVAFTWYVGVSGRDSRAPDGLLFRDSAIRFGQVTDGLSNTLLVGERPPSSDDRLGWWYAGAGMPNVGGAGDFFLGVSESRDPVLFPMCDSSPQRFRSGSFTDLCDTLHFWSPHPGGANFALADCGVRYHRYSAADLIPTLATRASGEVVPFLD